MKRERIFVSLLSVPALCAFAAAQAQEQPQQPFSYNYLFASVAMTELDSGGLELGGLFEVNNRVHLFLGYQDWDLGENAERSILQIGGAYRWALSPRVDAVARLAIADSDLDTRGRASVDDEGLIFGGGLRGWMSDRIELSGDIALDDSLGSDLEVVLEFGGQYYLDDRFSIGGRVRVDEEETTLFFGGRFYFRGAGGSATN